MKKFVLAAVALLPVAASAQVEGIQGLLETVNEILGTVIPIIFTLALIFFLWGLLKYILSAGDAGKQKEARGMMFWGIIIIAVMASVWGLVRILQGTLFESEEEATESIELPKIPESDTSF